MAPERGSAAARTPRQDFPPRWVGKALKVAFACTHYAAVAAAALVAYFVSAHLLAAHSAGTLLPRLQAALDASHTLQASHLLAAAAAAALVGAVAALALRRRQPPVYLLDFECYRPEDKNKVTYNRFITGSRDSGFFDAAAMDFQTRILHKSGLSDETFFPPGLHLDPPEFDMAWARQEAELVMFNAVADLLAKTGLQPRQVDVLVVNCSLFNPTPSLSAMVIHHFGMRSDIDSYNLGGMGCSAGMIAVDLAAKMLRERSKGGYALVVSTENITQNWYHGNERSMLIPNTIFRMGSAAVLLTSKASERHRSKYELQHVVRVHLGADDAAYKCVFQRPDEGRFIGVELSKDLVGVAGRAMEVNMTRLGPLVLPWSEKLMFAANWVARRTLRLSVPKYVPDFKQAFNHFCLHAGGRGVVEGLSKQLGLGPRQMAPSANTLHWYGNTSSSTVWYSFGFVESVQGVRKGDIVWQIGFGSGFKCNSVVWRALRDVHTMHKAWQHIEGREGQALETLQRIAAETAAERQQKQVDATVTVAAHQRAAPAEAADAAAAKQLPKQGKEDTAPLPNGSQRANGGVRVLRNGKVVAPVS
ncbi:3-ketoacyl-CoA synthase 1 [Chlorella vulgaris]